MIRERVVTGIRAAQAGGKRLGRPMRVFRRDQALRLRAEGKSWRQIAQELGVPFSTVIDACRIDQHPKPAPRGRNQAEING
jgi:DNA invertase Pin-like site-specific DNA recombinase